MHERELAVEALGLQGAQHGYHRGDTAAAGDEQDAPRPHRGHHEIAADGVEPDHHAGLGVVAQVGRHQTAVVAADGQLDVAGTLRAGRRVAAGTAAAVDLNRQIDVLAGLKSGEGGVGLQRQRDAT